MIYLLLFIIVLFIIRLILYRNFLLVVYDEYFYRDFILRIVEGGIGVVFWDLLFFFGFCVYSYLFFFYIVGVFFYRIFYLDYFFFVILVVYGMFVVLGFYFVYKEFFEDEKKVFLVILLLVFVLNFIYRISFYIFENMGLFLFFLSMFFGVRFF